jgi:hypothetical protein
METNKEDMAQMIDLPYAPDAEAAFLVSAIESPRRIGKVILEQGITSN